MKSFSRILPLHVLLAGAIAPAAGAQCTYPLITNGATVTASSQVASVRFATPITSFVALGLRSDAGSDHSLALYGATGGAPACGSGLLATSNTPAGVEVLVGDYRPGHNPTGPRFATGTRTSGTGGMTFELETTARILVAGTPPESSLVAPPVLDVYQTFLEAGSSYTFNLASAGPDLMVLVFRNPGANPFWAGRGAPEMLASANGPTLFTAPASDDYALVVVNDDGAAGTYTLWVELCQEPDTLLSTVARPVTYPYRDKLAIEDLYWQGVGVRPDAGSDWNLALYDTARGAPEPICFEGLVTSSSRTSGVDFVVGDLSSGPLKPFYVRELRAGGDGGATVEWDAGPDEIAVGDTLSPIVRTTGPADVLTVWDAYLNPGTTYTVLFSPSGSAELRWFLFANPAQGPGGERWFARDEAILTATGNALVTPTTQGWHGLVVVNENGAAGSYSLAIAGLPYVGVPDGGVLRNALGAIQPNPMRTRATIGFTLARTARVTIEIVDVAGRIVALVDGGMQEGGPGGLAWDGRDVQGSRAGPGVYFARLVVDGAAIGAARLVLLR